MARFAIRNPYFIIVVCLFIAVIGATSLVRMPVDLFPSVNIPVVAVATFYSGMRPEQIESNITTRYERFFTLGSGIDRMESRRRGAERDRPARHGLLLDPQSDGASAGRFRAAAVRREGPSDYGLC
ncbi:MAG: efflux RND transporter permease subunit [Blastocatellia bacterium]